MRNDFVQFAELIPCTNREEMRYLIYAPQSGCTATIVPEGVFMHAEKYGFIHTTARVIQEFLIHFKRDDTIMLRYAYTCSEPLPGVFGGGAFGIRRHKMIHVDAEDAVRGLMKNSMLFGEVLEFLEYNYGDD